MMKSQHSGLKTIGEVAAEFDVSYRTLRFYESRGLIKPIRSGLDRLYSPGDVIRLQLIFKGKRLGFTLSEIDALIASREGDAREPQDLHLDSGTILRQIQTLEKKRDDLRATIDELKTSIQQRGHADRSA